MLRRIDWSQHVPAGLDWSNEFKLIGIGHGASAGFSLLFVWRYMEAYSDLFHWDGEKRVLIEDVMMTRFSELYCGCMAGFALLALCMLALAAYHYGMHFVPNKSIYVMRRLPDRWELSRRVWLIPLLTLLACALIAGMLTLLYLALYYGVTPAQCIIPGQF